MNRAEVHALLVLCRGFDNRKQIDDLTVSAWLGALADAEPEDAQRAVVEHYRETKEFITVSDILAGARRIAKARAAAASDHAPGCWNIVPEFGAAAAEQVRALPAGHQPAEGSGLRELHRMLEEIAAKRAMPEVDENESASDRIYRSALVRARADNRERRRGNRVGD